MKPQELVKEVEMILTENNIPIGNCFQTKAGQLRLLGLSYKQFMFTAKCKDLLAIYTSEQIIDATKSAVIYLQTIDFEELNNETHIINTVVCAIKKSLEYQLLSSEDLEEVFKEIDI